MRAKLPHTEGLVDRAGTNIHYEIYGDGEHTMLIVPTWALVHSRVFKVQIPYFAEHFRVVVYDPRGNGRSDRPATTDGYRIDVLVDDVAAVLDATGTDRAILFSESTGGFVALLFAALHPSRASALVAVGTPNPLVEPFEYNSFGSFETNEHRQDGWARFSRSYWQEDYADFCAFFIQQCFPEPHSTKPIEDGVLYALGTDAEMLTMTMDAGMGRITFDEALVRRIDCPSLFIHGALDAIIPVAASARYAELTGGELRILPDAGHAPQARYPAELNLIVRDFLAAHLGTWAPGPPTRPATSTRRALYLSSPIGLGHARRDLAVVRELRRLHPELQVDWLAQDPVTRLLGEHGETIHPASRGLANESAHIESEATEHDLDIFESFRQMDEILVANFMAFQEVVEQAHYDLVIADEAWEIDHFWHEHPKLKRSQLAWFTDFVGYLPMPDGTEQEAFLTADYNAEMIELVERNPGVRDLALFVGNPDDVAPMGFGDGLPRIRDWVPDHYGFTGYILGRHPDTFGERADLRERFGYRDGEKVCIVTVGGSGVGIHLIRRILTAYPDARRRIPELRLVVVTGPRIDPGGLGAPDGVEVHEFVPDLDQRLAACDLAVVQGGLTTCMELTAAGTPFLYFPLRHHFEQNIHVVHRLDRYGAGRRMDIATSGPDEIAEAMVVELAQRQRFQPVERDGAERAAAMLAALL
jgi:pimeloyl-ACP methyl ester carboxylesterase/predicted glycosyltransferase